MKPFLISAAMAAGAVLAAPTAAAQDGETFILSILGGGRWSVECDITTDRGRNRTPDARGRGNSSTGSIVVRSAVSGTCVAEAGKDPLELTLRDDRGDFVCPFGDRMDGGICRAAVAEGAVYEFTIALSG